MLIFVSLTTIFLVLIIFFGPVVIKVTFLVGLIASALFCFANAFLDWLAHTHSSEKRMLPVCLGIAFSCFGVGLLIL